LARGRRGVLHDGHEPAVTKLGQIGAGARDAKLLREAIGRRLALVAALPVDPADHTLGTVAVVLAGALRHELAHVERTVAGDAPEPRRAVARGHAGVVAASKSADERLAAIGVDDAPRGQLSRCLVVAAGDGQNEDPDPSERPQSRASAQEVAQSHTP
jgi:hypothetical protein